MRGRLFPGSPRPYLALGVLMFLIALAGANLATTRSGPEPLEASAPDDRFSAGRAEKIIAEIAREPHPMGTPEHRRVRDHLVEQLEALGFETAVETGLAVDAEADRAAFGEVHNIVATLPGTDPTGTVLLVSHYDSVPSGPGAGDASTGVAALLETARAVASSGEPPRNDLTVLITDGEEMGLFGAESYTREHPSADAPTVVLNYEARGVSGPSIMFETSPGNSALISLFADAAPHPFADSTAVEIYRHMPNDTDFTRFSAAGYIGLNAAFIDGGAWYHSPGDDLEHLDRSSVQHHGSNALGLTSALVGADLAELESTDDSVFFNLFGPLVHFDADWTIALTAAAVALTGLAIALARRGRTASLPRIALAAVSPVVPLLAAGLAAQALWWLLTVVQPGYADMRGLVYQPWLYTWSYFAIALAATGLWFALTHRRLGSAATVLGALVWSSAVSVATTLWLGGASYLFSIPTITVAAVALYALRVRKPRPAVTAAVLAVGLAPVAIFAGWVANLPAALGMTLGAAPVALLVCYGVLLYPLSDLALPAADAPRGRLRRFGPAAFAGAVALALIGAGLAVDRFDTEQPRRAFLSYVYNANDDLAYWVSWDEQPSDWTDSYLDDGDLGETDLPESYVHTSGATGWGVAETTRLAAPTAEVLETSGRTVRLRLTSQRPEANTMWLTAAESLATVTVVYPGLEPRTVEDVRASAENPAQLWFFATDTEGVEVILTFADDLGRMQLFDQSHGLESLPGFTERPEDVIRSQLRLSDTVTVVGDSVW